MRKIKWFEGNVLPKDSIIAIIIYYDKELEKEMWAKGLFYEGHWEFDDTTYGECRTIILDHIICYAIVETN